MRPTPIASPSGRAPSAASSARARSWRWSRARRRGCSRRRSRAAERAPQRLRCPSSPRTRSAGGACCAPARAARAEPRSLARRAHRLLRALSRRALRERGDLRADRRRHQDPARALAGRGGTGELARMRALALGLARLGRARGVGAASSRSRPSAAVSGHDGERLSVLCGGLVASLRARDERRRGRARAAIDDELAREARAFASLGARAAASSTCCGSRRSSPTTPAT